MDLLFIFSVLLVVIMELNEVFVPKDDGNKIIFKKNLRDPVKKGIRGVACQLS